MAEYKDSVKDQTTTTGTGTVTIGGVAPAGYRTIASAHTDGATVRYRINLPDQSQWEVGEGVWTASGATLTRVTVFASSNSGSLVSFSAGTKAVITGADAQSLIDGATSKIQSIDASVAANALTLELDQCVLDFRSTTLTVGVANTRLIPAPITLVVPSGATLGTVNAVQSRLVLIAIDNAGTVELAVVNIAGGNNLDETTLISTTAITSGASSASVIYSTTARTNVPFRVVGFVNSTQVTAGTWATAPSLVQGAGGQALIGLSGLGYGQTWQDVSGSRTLATTYYNTTGRPIMVSVELGSTATSGAPAIVNGVNAAQTYISAGTYNSMTFIVPPGGAYNVSVTNGTPTLAVWSELR